jgi:hypothetical protein
MNKKIGPSAARLFDSSLPSGISEAHPFHPDNSKFKQRLEMKKQR